MSHLTLSICTCFPSWELEWRCYSSSKTLARQPSIDRTLAEMCLLFCIQKILCRDEVIFLKWQSFMHWFSDGVLSLETFSLAIIWHSENLLWLLTLSKFRSRVYFVSSSGDLSYRHISTKKVLNRKWTIAASWFSWTGLLLMPWMMEGCNSWTNELIWFLQQIWLLTVCVYMCKAVFAFKSVT